VVKCGGATWPRHGQPRGTQSTVVWQVPKISLESMGFEPTTSTKPKCLEKWPNTNALHMLLVICNTFNYICVVIFEYVARRGLDCSLRPLVRKRGATHGITVHPPYNHRLHGICPKSRGLSTIYARGSIH
jgi:hypothetical protein